MDGLGAAWSVWRNFKLTKEYKQGKFDGIKFHPVNYGDDLWKNFEFEGSLSIGPDDILYMVDFSCPRDEIRKFSIAFVKVIIIDHHETAYNDLNDIQNECPNVNFVYDVTRSGAVLTWKYFFPEKEVPEVLLYIEDRDLWRWKCNNSRVINEYMRFMISHEDVYQDFDALNHLHVSFEDPSLRSTMINNGNLLLSQQEQLIKQSVKHSRRSFIDGVECLVLNTDQFISDACHYMLKNNPDINIAIAYYEKNREYIYSLRSSGDFDVGELVKKFGGGGHVHAAGFKSKELVV
jgi:oligoribonuclease NrnB/cAMP/cGMP phosphodiesterase (DHH superfamily)